VGFVWFGPTSKVVKKVYEPYDRIQQRSKILLSQRKENNYTGIASLKIPFAIVHNFLLRTQN
jgi:hypothetical protein